MFITGVIDERDLCYFNFVFHCGLSYIFIDEFGRCSVMKITNEIISVLVEALRLIGNAVLSIYNVFRGR